MLQVINQQTIHKGFQLGGLVDLSRFTLKGCSKPIAATATLWKSILWAYPTAQKSDFLDPQGFIQDLYRDFASPFAHSDGQPTICTYLPSQAPAWLLHDFSISVYDHPKALLLSLQDEPMTMMFQECRIVPAGLILKISRLLIQLLRVARHNDRPHLLRLLDYTESLRLNHPLERQIAVAQHTAPTFSLGDLSYDEYRALLIEELGQLLEISFACGPSAEECVVPAAQYDKLCSPLSELAHLIRSLIKLAAAVPAFSAQHSPIDELLTAYSSVRRLQEKASSTVPKHFFELLRNDIVLLTQLLPRECAEELSRLQHKLAVLQSFAPTFFLGCTYPPKFNIFH